MYNIAERNIKMCRFISFFHNPNTGQIKVHNLKSHSDTLDVLKLNTKVWREGHYLPNNTVECRVLETDKHTQDYCNERLLTKYPKFKDFFNMCFDVLGSNYIGSLDLSGCNLKGITLPSSVGGSLDLSGCNLKGITLPNSIGGSLYLRGCDLKGITLPNSIGGSLYLSGCDLKGITLPSSISGSLYLSGCDLKGIKIPKRLKNKVIK